MSYDPIAAGSTGWDVPVNNAFASQDARISQNASDILGKVSKTGDSMTGALTAQSFNTDSTVRSAFLKTTSTTEHAVTIYQAGTSGSPGGVALNLISDNPNNSTVFVTGHEASRGSVKISHLNPGPGAGDDASSAALSIDLQRNGMGGTASQGIFITATEGATTGNLIVARNNSRDDFVVKGDGLSGVRMGTGEVPEAALEVKQGDTTTVGLVVTGEASTTVPIMQTKTSAGTATFEVGSSGAIVHRAISFYTNNLQLGSTSSDFGGGTGSMISMKNATANPSTNPTGGAILYTDAGAYKTRASNGNVWESARSFQLAPGPSPADQSFIAWNYDSENASSTNSLTLGTVFLHKVYLPAGVTITNLGLTVTTAGASLTYARIALYNAAGTQLAISGDQSSSWNSTGFKTNALGVAQSITTSGYYYIGVLTTGTTAPIAASSPGIQTTFNANVTGAGLRHASVATGQTALPGSITMSGNTSTGTSTWVTAF